MTDSRPDRGPKVLRQDELPSRSRGGGAITVPLATAERGATTFLNGITKFAAGSAIDHHIHNTTESVMIIKGDAIVQIGEARFLLRTYDTTLVPANIPHHFENSSSTEEMWILWTYGSIDATRTIITTGAHARIDAEDPSQANGDRDAHVHEVAEIDIKPGHEAAFEAAVATAVPLFQAAAGARTLTLERSIETPGRYRLVIGWDRVADHLDGFRRSPEFLEWRRLSADHFAAPPRVEHVVNALTGF